MRTLSENILKNKNVCVLNKTLQNEMSQVLDIKQSLLEKEKATLALEVEVLKLKQQKMKMELECNQMQYLIDEQKDLNQRIETTKKLGFYQ